MARKWVFYIAPGGGDPVGKDMQKLRLTGWEVARLNVVMDRVADGRALPGEVKALRDGVLEFKLDGQRRTFRMLFAEVDGGLLLLGLHFFAKKTQNARTDVDLAVQRLQSWHNRP